MSDVYTFANLAVGEPMSLTALTSGRILPLTVRADTVMVRSFINPVAEPLNAPAVIVLVLRIIFEITITSSSSTPVVLSENRMK